MKSAKAALSRTGTVRHTPTGSTRACSCWTVHHARLREKLCGYEPGDTYAVPRTIHEEHTEADGVRYVAGRRSAAEAAG
jgi:hypothetical protein